MKKRILKTLSLLGASFVFLPLLSGCSTAEDNIETINLRVLNCEDYIGEDDIVPFWDEAEEESYEGVLEAFYLPKRLHHPEDDVFGHVGAIR